MCARFQEQPYPVVAFYGLGKIAELSVDKFGEDVTTYVEKGFYVGDGLTLLPTETEAVDLIGRTQTAPQTS